MPNLDLALEFSHHHCVAICAVLVPANLLLTLQTLILTVQRAEQGRRWGSIVLANGLATLLSLHVLSWLWVGVVMPPTYILLSLALVCCSLNSWALLAPNPLARLLSQLLHTSLALARRVA
jgi:hypothetical protein